MHNAYETYRQTAVQTASPERLVLMLYEGGLKFLDRALGAMERQEWVEAAGQIRKTQDIVAELLSSINLEAGEMAQNLAGLYIYMNRRLSHASIHRDADALREVEKMLSELREAWEEILKRGTTVRQGGLNFEG